MATVPPNEFRVPNGAWFVVSDAARARIFVPEEVHQGIRFKEIESLVHPASRAKGEELETDGPGRAFDRGSKLPHRHAKSREVDVHEHEAEVFANEVADALGEAVQQNKVAHLYLAAAPQFLGLLRKRLSKAAQDAIKLELDRDLSNMHPDQILNEFHRHLNQ